MKLRLFGFLLAGVLLSTFAQSQYMGAGGITYGSLYSAQMSQTLQTLQLNAKWEEKFASLKGTTTETTPKPARTDIDAGKYKSTGKRITVETFLDAAGVAKANRDKAKKSLVQIFDGLEQAMDENKMKNDVFGSMSLFVCVNYAFATGKSLPSKALPVVYEQLRSLLGSKEMKSLSNTEKQTYSETLLLLTALPMVVAVATESDQTQMKTLKEVSVANLKNLLNLDASKLTINDQGLSIAP